MSFAVYEITCCTPKHRYIGFATHPETRIADQRANRGTMFVRRHGVESARVLCWVETVDEAHRVLGKWFSLLYSRGFLVGGCTSTDLQERRQSKNPKVHALAAQIKALLRPGEFVFVAHDNLRAAERLAKAAQTRRYGDPYERPQK